MEAKLSCVFFVVLMLMQSNVVVEGGGDYNEECNNDLTSFLPFPYNSLPHMVCTPLWNSYLLRYSKGKDHEITIVVSTIYTSGWVGIGFSRDGRMINSSCMVGWRNLEGHSKIKQFYVKGLKPSEVKSDEGELPLTNVPPFVAVQGSTIYLAFQLKFNKSLGTQPILLAFSTTTPRRHHHLPVHDDKTTIYFDFASGHGDSSSDDYSRSILKERRTHGTLAILGWGFFLPVGAILARYLTRQDSLWYYLHVGVQMMGFIFGVAAVVVGLSLHHRMHVSIAPHKGIGIFIFVLTILQVVAFFWRPNHDSKYRRYWKWYHNWMGRICLFFGAVNIAVGIHIAGAGQPWKIGYGFLLAFILVTVIVMEVLHRNRRRLEEPNTDLHPPLSMDKQIPL